MAGAELARAILRRRPGLRVLYMSGYAADGLPSGGELLKKPFTPGQLARRVRAVLGASRAPADPARPAATASTAPETLPGTAAGRPGPESRED